MEILEPAAHMTQPNTIHSTPFMSATSSPQRTQPILYFFYSAPTSPRSPKFHSSNLFDNIYTDDYMGSSYDGFEGRPFDWEVKPGVAKNGEEEINMVGNRIEEEEKEEFEFEFSGQLDMMQIRQSLSSADELFDGGKIRPLKLKPPPSLEIFKNCSENTSPKSPRSPKLGMCKFKEVLSPKRKTGLVFGAGPDPFEEAIRNTRRSYHDERKQRGRGRERISRSLSPLRVSEFALLHHQEQQNFDEPSNNNNNNSSSGLFGWNSSTKKWRLKDLFLFRSASEGHYKDSQSFSKRWSFRSANMVSGSGSRSGSVSGSDSGSVSKRRGQKSIHEMHYSSNRAFTEEMKKKTSLPYRHGLMACLGFSPVLPQFSYAFPNTPPS